MGAELSAPEAGHRCAALNAARDLPLRKPECHHGASVLPSKFCCHLNDRQAYSA